MSTPPKRHLPDLQYTQHGSHGGDKPGARQGTAGDATSLTRQDKEDHALESLKATKTEIAMENVDEKYCRTSMNTNNNGTNVPMADSNPDESSNGHVKGNAIGYTSSANDASGSEIEELTSNTLSDSDDTTITDTDERNRGYECLDYGNTLIYKETTVAKDKGDRSDTFHAIEPPLDGFQHQRTSVAVGIDKNELFATWKRIMNKTKPIDYSSESDGLNDEDYNSSLTMITDSDGESFNDNMENNVTIMNQFSVTTAATTSDAPMLTNTEPSRDILSNTYPEVGRDERLSDEHFSQPLIVPENYKTILEEDNSKSGIDINEKKELENIYTPEKQISVLETVPHPILDCSKMAHIRNISDTTNSENTPNSLEIECLSSCDKTTKSDESHLPQDGHKEIGAIGGELPEHITSILHKRSSDHRRTANVHFSRDVLAETTSQTGSDISSSSRLGVFSHGDGPPTVPIPPPPPTLISIVNQSMAHPPRSGPRDELQESQTPEIKPSLQNRDRVNGSCTSSTKGNGTVKGIDYTNDLGLNRQSSIPRMASPTEILILKQKAVTNKIMKNRQDDANALYPGNTDTSEDVQKKPTVAKLETFHSRARSNDQQTLTKQIRRKACEIGSCKDDDAKIIDQIQQLPNPEVDEGYIHFPNTSSESLSSDSKAFPSVKYIDDKVPGTSTGTSVIEQYHFKTTSSPDTAIQQEPHALTASNPHQCYEEDYYLCNPNMVDAHFSLTGARPKTTVNIARQEIDSYTEGSQNSRSQPYTLPPPYCESNSDANKAVNYGVDYKHNLKPGLSIPTGVHRNTVASSINDKIESKNTCCPTKNTHESEKTGIPKRRDSTACPWKNKAKDNHQTLKNSFGAIVEMHSDIDDDRDLLEQKLCSNSDTKNAKFAIHNMQEIYPTEAANQLVKSTQITQISAEGTEDLILPVNGTYTNGVAKIRRNSTAQPWKNKQQRTDHIQINKYVESIIEQASNTDADLIMIEQNGDTESSHTQTGILGHEAQRTNESAPEILQKSQSICQKNEQKIFHDDITQDESEITENTKYTCKTDHPEELVEVELDKYKSSDQPGYWFFRTASGEMIPSHSNSIPLIGGSESSEEPGYWFFKFSQEYIAKKIDSELAIDINKNSEEPGFWFFRTSSGELMICLSEYVTLVESLENIAKQQSQCDKANEVEESVPKHTQKQYEAYPTVPTLLRKIESCNEIEKAQTSPVLGVFDYTTPSRLFEIINDMKLLANTEETVGPVHNATHPDKQTETIIHPTSSKLLRKFENRNETETAHKSPGLGAFDYTTPSRLLENRNDMEMLANTEENVGPVCHASPPEKQSETTICPTSSKFLRMIENQNDTEKADKIPGLGAFEDTTSSRLFEIINDMELLANTEETVGPVHNATHPDKQSETIIHPTSSKLLRKIENRNETETTHKSPGLGAFDYTTPSRLLENRNDMEMLANTEENVGPVCHASPPEKQSETTICPTSSKFMRMIENQNDTEKPDKIPGLGAFEDTTSSRLFEKQNDRELLANTEETVGPVHNATHPEKQSETIIYPMLSKLLRKIENRNETETARKSLGLGAFDYTAPSRFFEKINNMELLANTEGNVGPVRNATHPEKQSQTTICPTSSKFLRKIEKRNETEKADKSPGLGAFDYTTPPRLFEKINDMELLANTEENVGPVYNATPLEKQSETIIYPTSSKLLRRIENRIETEKAHKSPGLGAFDYTTSSRLFERMTDIEGVTNSEQITETIRNTPPPATVEKCQEMENVCAETIKDEEKVYCMQQPCSGREKGVETAHMDFIESVSGFTPIAESVEQPACTCVHDAANENTPGLEYFTYKSPSKLFQIIQELIDTEHVRGKDVIPNNYKMLDRSENLHVHKEKSISTVSQSSDVYSYATPSKLIESIQEVIDTEKVRDIAISWLEKSKQKKEIDKKVVHDFKLTAAENVNFQLETGAARKEISSIDKQAEEALYTQNLEQQDRQYTDEVTFENKENVGVHVNKWRTRCRRKERLDRMQRRVLTENIEDGNGQVPGVYSTSDSDVAVEILGKGTKEQHLAVVENYQTVPDITAPFKLINGLLSKFINTMHETEMLGLPFKEEDFKELQLIYSVIANVAETLDEVLGEPDISQVETHADICVKNPVSTATNTCSAVSSDRSAQLQNYLGLLSSVLLRTVTYLQVHSEPDLSKYTCNSLAEIEGYIVNEQNTEETKQKDFKYDNHVTFEDIILDIDSVRQSTCNLLSEYGTFSDQMFIPHKISKDSLASGYIADQCSSDDSIADRSKYASHRGYVGDVSSSEITLPSQTVMHGWTFSNEFLDRTSPYNEVGEHPTLAQNEWYYRDQCQSRSPSMVPLPQYCDSSLHIMTNPIYKSSDSEPSCYTENKESTDTLLCHDSIVMRDPTMRSDISLASRQPERQVQWSGPVCFPEDPECVHQYISPSGFTMNQSDTCSLEERSPERGQRLFSSSQGDRRGDSGSKRKQPVVGGRGVAPDARSHLMEKEVVESQNRKLQTEVSRLQTENKLIKDKHNRAQSRISDLESQLQDAQGDLDAVQDNLTKEMSAISSRNKSQFDHDRQQLQAKILTLTQENESLNAEVSSLEKQLDSSHRVTDMARNNSEKTRTLEAHKAEISTLKEELGRVKALLEQSERHLHDEEDRHSAATVQILRLTELKNALQQQADIGSNGTTSDKQLSSLEARLKVTEERLHQERADRANNLSSVEDKLLTENARLQAVEKDMTRQLHREKDKNRNLDHRMKQTRDENEKLRLAIPFDDSTLLSDKDKYDIPYSSHSNQRAESMKVSDDMNYIYSQIERQDGVQSNQSEELIRTIWNKRELAYRQLRAWELQIEELQLADNNNLVDGLKNLRDTYGQAESKLRTMEEKLEDAQAQMTTLDTTYKFQLSGLVQERHEAYARLKTAEDILAAMKLENETLHRSIGHVAGSDMDRATLAGAGQGQLEALQVQCASLEGKVSQLTRSNSLLEGEVTTARIQLEARTKELQDCRTELELELAYSRLQGDSGDERKQVKIDKLTAQVTSLQAEVKQWTDKFNVAVFEKLNVDSELSSLRKSLTSQKPRQQKAEQVDSKQVEELREELADRDTAVASVNQQLDEAENQLQKLRQELYIEQEHTAELEFEVDTLQQTVTQRANMFEALSGTEREQLAQYQVLKDSLDAVSQELAQKHAQIISLDVNLSGQKDKTAELEKDLHELRESQSHNGGPPKIDVVTAADKLRIHELEIERASLKQELMQTYKAIQASEEQFRALQTESKQLEQEIVKDKTIILQVTAEKGEVEQHLEELAEEHDSLIQEKIQAEDDLLKLEQKLQEILQKYEAEARKQHGKFDRQYTDLPADTHKLVSELDSVRLLLDGRDKELEMLEDRISRQVVEIEFLHRKVDLVHNDSIQNREDVARMISELTLKMKEAVSTREVNQFLAGERTKLTTQHQHMEQELELERRNNDQRKHEINDVIRKIERGEHHQKSAEKDNQEKSHVITSLEADLRNSTQNLADRQSENSELRSKVDQLGEDVKELTAVNATLEKQFEMEKQSLHKEKTTSQERKDDLNRTSHDLESLRHEYSLLTNTLVVEQQAVESLKRDVEAREGTAETLKGDLEMLRREADTNKGQLLITKDTVNKLTQDKGSIHQDYEAMCRSLTEKERQLTELRERMDERLEGLKREYAQERIRLERETTSATQERDLSKQEADSLNEQLRQKEIQLNTFGKTLQEVQEVTRAKKQLEGHVQRLEASQGDSKLLLEGHRKELTTISDAHAKQQESHTRLQAQNQILQADMKSLKESSSREERELKITINELKSQHNNERHYLNDNLAQTQTTLRTLEASFASATEQRDAALAQKRLQESTIEDLESRLSDENTGRRLTEQSVGTIRLQLEDSKNDKNVAEARFAEANHQVSKLEGQLKVEQDRNKKLAVRLQQLGTVAQSSEGSVRAKTEHVETLQKETSKLRQLLESQKQNLSGKMKKTNLEYKQQMDLVLEEKEKLVVQVQQLTTSLDTCKEQVTSKNKANLKLQEELLCLESSVNESKVKAKHAEDTLRAETESQSHLSSSVDATDRDNLVEWYRAQEEELKRLRNFLAKKAENSGEADKAMWQEMNRVIQELSRQMQDHLDTQKPGDKDDRDVQRVTRLKKQMSEMRGELSTEKSLHQITKTSLQALEEDCQRLRNQLYKHRRREGPASDKKYKNRMEAINAIIARSQTQAQALLASGGYMDDSLLSPRSQPRSPRVGYHSPRRPESPDDSYAEDLSIASLPPMHYATAKTSSRFT